MSAIVASFPLELVKTCLDYQRQYSPPPSGIIAVRCGPAAAFASCGNEPLRFAAGVVARARWGYATRYAYVTESGKIIYPS